MSQTIHTLSCLRRPRLLIRAARIGADEYRRTTHLGRLLGGNPPRRHADALDRLMSLEAEQEELRCTGSASYGVALHVEILSAMMAEARLVNQTSATPQARDTEASGLTDLTGPTGSTGPTEPTAPRRPDEIAGTDWRASRPRQMKASAMAPLRSRTNASSASRVAGSISGAT
ncbi:DUF6477 family protein [Roseivivax sp. CAU 1753]